MLKPVAGTVVQAKTSQENTVQTLEKLAQQIKDGTVRASEALILLRDNSDPDVSFTSYEATFKSMTSMIGFMELMKFRIINEDMLEEGD